MASKPLQARGRGGNHGPWRASHCRRGGGAGTDLGEEAVAGEHDGCAQPQGRLVGEATAHLVRGRGRGWG